jgi:S-adenosylmethionine uptake transporter
MMSVLTRKLGATSRASALALHMQIAFIAVSLCVFVVAGDGRFAASTENESIRFLLRAWIWPPMADVLPITLLGLVAAAVGYLMAQAYRLSPASAVAPFEYSLLIYALFWGWTIFGEWPAPMVFAGAAVVIGSGIYVFVREGQRKSVRRV